jgi:hypothetical protein
MVKEVYATLPSDQRCPVFSNNFSGCFFIVWNFLPALGT